jgi:hypothetical protein
MKDENLIKLIRTLLCNGYYLNNVRRLLNSALLSIYRIDLFGAKVLYSLLTSSSSPPRAVKQILIKDAKYNHGHPIYVGDYSLTGISSFTPQDFFNKLGGEVRTGLLMQSGLPKILDDLGKNKLPKGLVGNPDDLLEEYTKESLQFLFGSPARRFGQDRLFEPLPDGIVIGENGMILQFDSKAYGKGHSISADDIKRYGSYIESFNKSYGSHLGRVHSFLVVTGKFGQSRKSLQKKSDDLYSRYQTKVVCLETKDMGEIVEIFKRKAKLRTLIDWNSVFSQLIITKSLVTSQLRRIEKDNLIRE